MCLLTKNSADHYLIILLVILANWKEKTLIISANSKVSFKLRTIVD